ncbi:MAG TPA: hypothetical protein PKA88_15945, partial [Polyangiaceae bacterium]|nr:hypothetical protein [Polyangiaceae bacterium]
EGWGADERAPVFEIPTGTGKSRLRRPRGWPRAGMQRVVASPALLQSTQTIYAAWLGRKAERADAR